MRNFPPATFAALAVAACNQTNAPAPEPSGSEAPLASPAAPAPTASSTPTVVDTQRVTQIPTAVQGRWGLVSNDCDPTRSDAKGLLSIDPDTLTFYESRAKLGQVKEIDESRIRASFEFSGEGMTWSRDEVLDAQDGGKTLIRREYGEDAATGPMRYTRCR